MHAQIICGNDYVIVTVLSKRISATMARTPRRNVVYDKTSSDNSDDEFEPKKTKGIKSDFAGKSTDDPSPLTSQADAMEKVNKAKMHCRSD